MPAQNPSPKTEPGTRGWAAQRVSPPASVFGNFASKPATESPPDRGSGTKPSELSEGLRSDGAMARSFLYAYLARAFEDPHGEGWLWLSNAGTYSTLSSAATLTETPEVEQRVSEVAAEFGRGRADEFAVDYIAAFGHAARGRCPMNEIEYGDANADPLFQPHRLADLAAFYRAFGLEPADDAGERQDHLCMELEFMSVLAAKLAYAVEHRLEEESTLCVEAQKKFLREHLGRWGVAFAGRLMGEIESGPLPAMARLLRAFILAECARFGVTPGSDVLVLRPVDESAERLCGSCGLGNPPPGAIQNESY